MKQTTFESLAWSRAHGRVMGFDHSVWPSSTIVGFPYALRCSVHSPSDGGGPDCGDVGRSAGATALKCGGGSALATGNGVIHTGPVKLLL